MRKRKSPVLLVSVLVISGGLVVFMSPKPKAIAEATPPPTTPEVGKEVNTPDKEAIAKGVKDKLKAKTTTPERRKPSMGGGPESMPHHEGPLALKEKPKPYMPVPSDSMTSSRWWSDATPKDYSNLSTPAAKPKKPTSDAPVNR